MEYNKTIDQFISYYLEPHEERISEEYPDSIFWVKGGEVIAEIRNSKVFSLKSTILKRIYEMFDLDYNETQSVIKVWLEQHYNLGGLAPSILWSPAGLRLEQHYDFG
jgi:hypothetical protein